MINPCCCGSFCPPFAPVDAWENVTKVTDYNWPLDPAGAPPYARLWHEDIFSSCHPAWIAPANDCGNDPATAPSPDAAKACAYQGFDRATLPRVGYPPTGVLSCRAGAGETIDHIIDNCYRKLPDKATITRTCRGWKGVQAFVHWPGISWGFTDCSCVCYNDGAGTCDPPLNPQFKYSTIAKMEKFTETWNRQTNPDYLYGYTEGHVITKDWQQTATVDGDGNMSRTGHRQWTDRNYTTYNSGYAGTPPDTDLTYNDNCTGKPQYGSAVPDKVPFDSAADVPVDVAVNGCGGTLTWVLPSPGAPTTDTLANLNAMNLFAPPSAGTTYPGGSTERIISDVTGNGAVFTLSNTRVTVKFNGSYRRVDHNTSYSPGDPLYVAVDETYHWDYEYSMEISGSITFASVVARAEALLDLWRLQDDKIYPWRTDAATWKQPLVTHDGAATVPNIAWAVVDAAHGDCSFSQGDVYTGDTLGAPTPPGYAAYYDFNHINYYVASDGAGGCYECEGSLGAANPLSGICATHWTNYKEGGLMFGPGAHLTQRVTYSMSTTAAGTVAIAGVYAQKWAETLEAWPRVNYSRCPGGCGADRDVIDNRTDCTSTTKRWPTARAICGRLRVLTAVQSGADVILTTDAKTWLAVGDYVDFAGTVGSLGDNLAATPISDTSFSVVGTLGSYAGGGYVHSHELSFDYAWASTCPDHTFIWREFNSLWREYEIDGGYAYPYTVTVTQETLAPSSTAPSVLFCSPNADDAFDHSFRATWGSITADLCYGKEWHLDFQQTMTDPFWTRPDSDALCGTMDSYPCASDGDYPYHPLVEAAITAPVGAPSLPSGVTLWPTDEAGNGMPSNVGFPTDCTVTPNDDPTCHNLRAAWLACDDWRAPTNHDCASL